jgi:serine/threonine protein kinase, bacterial
MSGSRLCRQGHSNPLSSRYCHQCGTPLLDGDGLVERIVGDRYRIIRNIGHGGFGQTYLAEDINRFNEQCVLKELAPIAENQDSLEKAKQLFAREAEVLYKLQHSQIPRFREWFVEPDRQSMFLVQDYVEGPTYQEILQARATSGEPQSHAFSESEVITLLTQLLPVLTYIHSQGVIHRDLSPDNLICRNIDRLPVLIDFGGVKEVAISAVQRDRVTTGGGTAPAATPLTAKPNVTLIGKPGYSPEEQLRHGQVSAASDLYALGVTALVLLTGEEPSAIYDAFHLTFDWQKKTRVSDALAVILDKMVAQRLTDRYQTTADVLQDLRALSASPAAPDWAQAPIQDWQTAPAAVEQSVGQTVGSLKTMVVAPLGTAVATAMVTPAAQPQRTNTTPVAARVGPLTWLWQRVWGLTRSLLLFLLLVGTGALGWSAVRWWLQTQTLRPPANPTFTSTEISPQTQSYSATEQQRKAQLLERLNRSRVSSSFFYRFANEAYYLQYPDQRGRLLSNAAQDEPLRRNWDQVASQVLVAIEAISPASQAQLGRFTIRDRLQWQSQFQAAQLNTQQVGQEAEATLVQALPMYRGVNLRGTAAGQLVDGIIADRVQRL